MTKAPADVLPGQLARARPRAAAPAAGVSAGRRRRPGSSGSPPATGRSGSARGFSATPPAISCRPRGGFSSCRRPPRARRSDPIRAALGDAVVLDLEIEDGEAAKSLATVEKIAEAALAAGLRRDDAFVAVGGGVATDVDGIRRGDPAPRRRLERRADDDGRHGRRRDRRENRRQPCSRKEPARRVPSPAGGARRSRPASRRCPSGTTAPASSRRTRRPGSRTRSSRGARRGESAGRARARRARPSSRSSRGRRASRRRSSTADPRDAGRPASARTSATPSATRSRPQRLRGNAAARRGGGLGHRRGAGDLEAARRPAGGGRRGDPPDARPARPFPAARARSREARAAPRPRQEGDGARARRASCSRRSGGRGSRNRSRFRGVARRGRYNVVIVSGRSGRRRIRLFVLLSGALILASLVPLLVAEAVLIRRNRRTLETLEEKYLTRSSAAIADHISTYYGAAGQQLTKAGRRHPAGRPADGQGSLRLDRGRRDPGRRPPGAERPGGPPGREPGGAGELRRPRPAFAGDGLRVPKGLRVRAGRRPLRRRAPGRSRDRHRRRARDPGRRRRRASGSESSRRWRPGPPIVSEFQDEARREVRATLVDRSRADPLSSGDRGPGRPRILRPWSPTSSASRRASRARNRRRRAACSRRSRRSEIRPGACSSSATGTWRSPRWTAWSGTRSSGARSCLAGALLLGLLFARRLSRPIAQLADSTRAVAAGRVRHQASRSRAPPRSRTSPRTSTR